MYIILTTTKLSKQNTTPPFKEVTDNNITDKTEAYQDCERGSRRIVKALAATVSYIQVMFSPRTLSLFEGSQMKLRVGT